jgi:hypothetical protein
MAILATCATSNNAPVAIQRLPSKAVQGVCVQSINYPDKIKNELYPDIN